MAEEGAITPGEVTEPQRPYVPLWAGLGVSDLISHSVGWMMSEEGHIMSGSGQLDTSDPSSGSPNLIDWIGSEPPSYEDPHGEGPWWRRKWVGFAAGIVFLMVALWQGGVFSSDSSTDRFLDEAMVASLEMGMSQQSWECIERGLRQGGYLDGMEETLDGLDEDAFSDIARSATGVADVSPGLAHLFEGLMHYMVDPVDGCLSPQEIAGLTPSDGDWPMTIGSDVGLDMLHDGCTSGSFADCDMLWITSPPGSEYETAAEACGGVNEPIDFMLTSCIAHHGAFTELDVVRADCEKGFFPACDLLYYSSAPGSDDEEFGMTCGDRRTPNASAACWGLYGHGSRS